MFGRKISGKKIRLLALVLCVALLFTGCVATDTSSQGNQKKIVYVVEDEEIIYYGDGSSNNQNNNASSNVSNVSSDGNSSSGTSTEEDYKMLSSGEWKQERFYLSSCIGPSDYDSLLLYKDAGYNLIECAGEGASTYLKALDNANKIGGLYCMFADEFRLSAVRGDKIFNEQFVRNCIYEYAAHDPNRTIIGYQVCDEPYMTEEFITDANRMIKYINKYDPATIKFVNLLPSYGVYTWDSEMIDDAFGSNGYESYVETFINRVDPQIISLDYYPYLMGTYGDTGDWFRDMGWFRKMSLKYDKPLWYYYQIIQISGRGLEPTNDQIRYQMYVGLAYGAKELSGWNSNATEGGEKTKYFEDTKARNAELMAMGTYLLDKTTTKIYHTGTAGHYTDKFYLDKLSESNLIESAPDRLIMSVFEDGKTNTKYLLVVNKNTEKAMSGTINLKSNKSISKFNRTTGGEDLIATGSSIPVSINAGGGEIYILK